MSVIIYSKPNCTQCERTKRQLERGGVAFEVRDVTLSTLDYEKAVSYGYRSFPIVVTDTTTWGGLDPDKIVETVKRLGGKDVEEVKAEPVEDCGCGI